MNLDDDNAGTESQVDLDTSAALAEISSDLFGQGGEDSDEVKDQPGEGEGQSPASDAAVVEVPPSHETPEEKPEGENSEEVQATGAPSTWSKEALAEWASIPPRSQQEILKREEDMFRGIEQYKGAAEIGQKYEAVVEPFKAVLDAENIDPVGLFQSFASNHYLLSRGTPDQKIQLAAALLQGYNIDMPALLTHLGDAVNEPPDPVLTALQREVQELKSANAAIASRTQEATAAQVKAEVDAFAADPAHPYFDELINDIDQFMRMGASTLQEAYDKAVFANPVTRQKEIDKLTASKLTASEAAEKARKDKIARSTAADLKVVQKSRDGTVLQGSMDDTLHETLAAIESRA